MSEKVSINTETSDSPARGVRASAAVYDGRQLLGVIKPSQSGYSARGADGRSLGEFKAFDDARRAIGGAR